LTIKSLARGSHLLPAEIASVELVSGGTSLATSRDASGLRVTLPPAPATRPHAVALRVTTVR